MAETVVIYRGPIVTVEDARAVGDKRYFTGRPCVNGHIQQRIVSSNGCLTCDLNRKKSKYNPVKASENKKRQKEARDAKKVWKPKPPNSVLYDGPIVTRKDALKAGLKRYFLGTPCAYGHISQRQTTCGERQTEGRCVKCVELYRERKRTVKAGRPRPSVCDICEGDGSSHRFGRILYDHCHQSGKFRGWICNDCNAALGFAKDNPKLLRKMARYLEKNGGKTNSGTKEPTPIKRICWAE